MPRQMLTAFPLLLLSGLAVGQTVSSSVNGVLNDASGAAIVGASCALSNQATGVVAHASSGVDGLFTFPTIPAGSYTLVVQMAGFKALEIKDVVVISSEIRSLGNLVLQVGEVKESVAVTANTAPLQLASAEKSGVVTGTQVNDLALQGRDFFAFLQTIPGVVDTKATREATTNSSNAGVYINGARDNQKNFSVDGVVDHDTHS